MEVVVATRNRHKFKELTALLKVPGVRWRSLEAFPRIPAVEEGGRTFDANAIRKAQAIAGATGCAALADDSGLEVEALGGRPGVGSARFAGRHGDDQANNEKLLRVLRRVPPAKRRARYRCSLALAVPRPLHSPTKWPSGKVAKWPKGMLRRPVNGAHVSGGIVALTRGIWQGRIAERAKGHRGFGYDPLFLVSRFGKTVAELPAALKARLSHRAKAARCMRPVLARLARCGRCGLRGGLKQLVQDSFEQASRRTSQQ